MAPPEQAEYCFCLLVIAQKTTLVRRWATYPIDPSTGSLAYATVFGCDFTSDSHLIFKPRVVRQKTTLVKGGQPILLTGQWAAQHTQ